MYHVEYLRQKEKQEELLRRKNEKSSFYNGIYLRWKNPVLTRDHVPLHWRYDLNPETNPFFLERLGVNAVFNAGAIYLNGKYCLVVRVEGNDRKSFFAVAESTNGIDNFRFREKPVVLPDLYPDETNVYDMRLTQHEDGWIYGVFCSESSAKDPADLSAAVAGSRHCPHQGFEHVGTPAESGDQAKPPAAERLPASEIRRREVCVLYQTDGRFH